MNPKLCLNTSTIKPQPLMEKIRLAGEVGYDGIELWINDLYEHIGQGGEISDIEKALETARKVMLRRGKELSSEEELNIRQLHKSSTFGI